jgi:phenylacetic acid degradation operon negative regulatory protein
MPTPQSVLMTMLGRYCAEANPPLATSGYIDVLRGIGVSEHATRLTLARMTERGLLERRRRGRIAYYRATELALNVVRNQDERTFREGAVPPGPEGVWTILTFSVPETQRHERHLLRRRLAWEGFGLLRDGVWIAPGDHDLAGVIEELVNGQPHPRIEAFAAYPKFSDVKGMISRAWQLEELARQYQQFLDEWDVPSPAPAASDALARDLLLISAWRQLLRDTPRLPTEHMPEDWPAARCLDLFHTLHASYDREARRLFGEILAHNTCDA